MLIPNSGWLVGFEARILDKRGRLVPYEQHNGAGSLRKLIDELAEPGRSED